jgi:molybdopterin-guanine dinucleotide biosynthesis protein A
MIERHDVTGLVLAGGRGSRMGGVDKGLQTLQGEALVGHALGRLRPQVGALAISANRHLPAYAVFGAPVWPDADTGFAGPLAGFLAGLEQAGTDWLATVPCDAPRFPTDLVRRLAGGLGAAPAAIAVIEDAGELRRQPVFCLLRRDLRDALAGYLAQGGRRIDRWLEVQGCAEVRFEDPGAFFNANTLEDLRRLGDA